MKDMKHMKRMLKQIANMQKELEQLAKDEIAQELDGQPVECAIDALQNLTEQLEFLNENN